MNPRADIASVVLQSTSTTPPATLTPWVGNGGLRRPRSGHTIAVTTASATAVLPSTEVRAGTRSSSTGKETPILLEREFSRDQQVHDPDEVVPNVMINGDGRHTLDGGVVDPRKGAGGREAGAQPRSLMGRMLASGMLDRQREWAKARGKKVTVRSRLSYPINVLYVYLLGTLGGVQFRL